MQTTKLTTKTPNLSLKPKRRYSLKGLTLGLSISLILGAGTAFAVSPVTYYEYDANGNMTKITDGLGHATIQQYDALNRLKKQRQPNPTAAGQLGEITMQYNAIDQMTAVTDPRNLTTSYGYNAHGHLLSLASPDTGTTLNTYDEAGNIRTKQDAKGQITTYSYDALNRLTQITYADNQTVTYSYDGGINGIGRLYQISDATGTTTYSYDQHGRITGEARSINGFTYTVSYVYNAQGQLTEISYPTSLLVTYSRDSLGRISAVTMTKNGEQQPLATNITYQPFGGIKSFTYGNGRVFNRSYDLDNRLNSYSLGNKTMNIAYDAASRIQSLNNPANIAEQKVYGYDNLDRLTSMVTPTSGSAYEYDLSGNRTMQGYGGSNYPNTIAPNSNRMLATTVPVNKTNTFDANGSITNDTVNQYSYDARGRLIQTTTAVGTVSFGVNALGQRVVKSINGATTIYHYDINGQLIAETDAQGKTKEETIYLGNMPLAVIK